jgi:diaminohydroxyphosphoribosylaminopyrimidine deaminase / 5-amino-6-(5-phosphoribosylamino)uracil reductase
VMTSAAADRGRRDALVANGADVMDASVVQNRLWLPSVMEALVARGITRVLVEGGPGTWRAFADASLVDEVALYMAGDCSNTAMGAVARYLGDLNVSVEDKRPLGPDTLWRFRQPVAAVYP